jgi:hypothetical protein
MGKSQVKGYDDRVRVFRMKKGTNCLILAFKARSGRREELDIDKLVLAAKF